MTDKKPRKPHTRKTPDARHAEMLDAALRLAEQSSYRELTREKIAAVVDCSPALVSLYFGRMDTLRDEVMRAAVERDVPAVIAQGLAARDPIAQGAESGAKTRALEGLLS